MRLKILLTAGLGASLVLLSLIFLKPEQATIKNPEINGDSQEDISRSNSLSLGEKASRSEPGASNNSPEQILSAQTNSVDERIIELTELGARSDVKSFQKIIASLQDAEREIRRAAVDATIQFGSRDAIPILKELAAKAEDAREKVELLDAAEFLKLPSLSEIRRSRRANPPKP